MRLSPFMRQLYVALPSFFASLSSGGAVCYPTVLLQQLKVKDTPIQIDFETASWMGSIHGFAGILSIFIPILMQWKGRKYSFIFTCIIMTVGWILAYFSADAVVILLSESFHGLGSNCFLAVSCLTITEMMTPKYRHTFMQIVYIIQTAGMAADGLFVKYYHWRTISIIMLVPMIISVIIACTVPESPYWLAYKGDYTKCEKNFIWLRGSDENSNRELNKLINRAIVKPERISFGVKSVRYVFEKLISRDFLIPAVHICLLQLLIHGSGSIVTLIYSIEMLKRSTGMDEISSYGGLIMNSLLLVGFFISLILDRYFNTKSVLITSVFCAIVCLVIGSAFSYLQTIELWPKESVAGLFCLSGFVLSSSVGIIGPAYSIAATLIPVKHRGVSGALLVMNTSIYHALALKSAPYMFLYLNMWGTYLVYSAVTIMCGLLIWKFVPEIKGRSLQEIDNFYQFGSYAGNTYEDPTSENRVTMITKNSFGGDILNPISYILAGDIRID